MKAKSIITLITCFALAKSQLNTLYTIDAALVNAQAITTPVVANTALGQCTCDITLNSCDIYCCCDTDCSATILQFWNSNYQTYCTKAYIGSEYKPFTQCMSLNHLYSWNQRMGMQISQSNNELCVELDSGTLFSTYQDFITYYNDSLSQVQENDLQKQTFLNQGRSFIQTSTNSYSVGDEILAYQNAVYSPFKLPTQDFFGSCSNYNGQTFLVPSPDQSCSQKVMNLTTACGSLLNPSLLLNGQKVLKGGSTDSTQMSLILGDVYSLNSTDGSYTPITIGLPQSQTGLNGSCSCSNALKEAHYSLSYSSKADGSFVADSLKVSFLLYDQLNLPKQYCNDVPISSTANVSSVNLVNTTFNSTTIFNGSLINITNFVMQNITTYNMVTTNSVLKVTAPYQVQQTFSFNFEVSTSGVAPIKRSGNPGYVNGYPLLVGQSQSGGTQLVNANGFRLFSGDSQGKCFPTLSSKDSVNFPTSLLTFGQSLTLSCSIQLTLAQLQEYCSQSTASPVSKKDLQIYSQIFNDFQTIGKFGNSDTSYSQDWISVINDDINGFVTGGQSYSWNSQTNTCSLQATLSLNILSSLVGYVEKPQAYIVGAVRRGILRQWTYQNIDTSVAQSFQHTLEIQFTEVVPDQLLIGTLPTSGWLPKLPADLFYPLNLQMASSKAESVLPSLFILAAVCSISLLLQ